MKLDTNNSYETKRYNDFIKFSPFGHFQQDMRWAALKSNWKSAYFYAEEDGKIIGALSLIYIEDTRVNKNFFYAPRGPVCDLRDLNLVKKLIKEAYDFAKENHGFLLRIDPLFPYDETLITRYRENGVEIKFDKERSSQPLLNMVLSLKKRDLESIFRGFSKNTKKHIRKSYKDGLYTREEGVSGIDILFQQILATSSRAKIGHRPFQYFKRLYELYKEEIRLSVCYLGGEPVCSSLLLCYGNRATSLYGGSSNQHREMTQNYQINFEEIKYCAENNIDFYDMGGIFEDNESDGLYAFKRKFTEDHVEKLIGEMDIIIDSERYEEYRKEFNPHFKRIREASNNI